MKYVYIVNYFSFYPAIDGSMHNYHNREFTYLKTYDIKEDRGDMVFVENDQGQNIYMNKKYFISMDKYRELRLKEILHEV